MADKKLTDVEIISSASGSDSLILIKNGVTKSVRQVLISDLNIQGGGTSGVVIGVELRKNASNLEYRTKLSNSSWSVWKSLFPLIDIKGEPGSPGKNGITPNVTIGSVTTVEPGTTASVTNTGTFPNVVLNFKIPRGASGTGSGDVTTSQMNSAINQAIQSHASASDGKYATKSSVATKTDVPFKFQKITQGNYDSLGSKDPNTVYLIVG